VCVGITVFSTQAPAPVPVGAITWSDVAARYAGVHDYTCLYQKQERAIDHGALQTLRLSFRKPLDVRLEWLDDKGEVDQIAAYREGRNDGKVIARRRGMLGWMAGTVRLDPRGRLALQDSRHPITEVGLGYIIDRAARDMRDGRVTTPPVVEDPIDGRPSDRFQFDASGSVPLFGIGDARRAVVWVDRALKLPIKVEIMDGEAALIERHRFADLRLNQGLSDAVFTL
jgi:hypothetical protein